MYRRTMLYGKMTVIQLLSLFFVLVTVNAVSGTTKLVRFLHILSHILQRRIQSGQGSHRPVENEILHVEGWSL